LPFLSVGATLNSISVNFGTIANYPLSFADVSSVDPFEENQASTLPLSILNQPSTGSATFSANAYIAFDIELTATLTLTPGGPPLATATYSANELIGPKLENGTHVTPGLGVQSGTTLPLPADGATTPFAVVRGLGVTVDPAEQLVSLLCEEESIVKQTLCEKGLESIRFPITAQAQLDGGIAGGTVNGQLSITNSTPSIFSVLNFEPDAVPGTSQNFTALAPQGTVVPNVATFQAAPNEPIYSGTVSLQTDFYASTPLAALAPDPVAIYTPGPFAFKNAVFQPSTVQLTLMASPSPAPTVTPPPTEGNP
jgi:hypothetical protein